MTIPVPSPFEFNRSEGTNLPFQDIAVVTSGPPSSYKVRSVVMASSINGPIFQIDNPGVAVIDFGGNDVLTIEDVFSTDLKLGAGDFLFA